MEHPRLIRAVHRFFNPVRYSELRDHEAQRPPERTLRKQSPGDPMSEYERRREEILKPNQVSYAKVYTMVGLSVAAAVTVLLFVVFR